MSDELTCEASKAIADKIKRFQYACTRLAEAERELNSARCEFTNSQNEVGRSLVPKTAVVGERYSIWYGQFLVRASLKAQNDYTAAIETPIP